MSEEQAPVRSPAHRRRIATALLVAVAVLVAATVVAAVQGGWWAIVAVGFGGIALLALVAGIGLARDPTAVETVMARQSAAGGVNRAAEQAVRKTGGGGAGGMGSGVAPTPALYRETQPWDDGKLPEPINASGAGNRAQRRAGARAVQRREAKISQREVDRRRALDNAQRPRGGPPPKGR